VSTPHALDARSQQLESLAVKFRALAELVSELGEKDIGLRGLDVARSIENRAEARKREARVLLGDDPVVIPLKVRQ
jgi:hypothetical protein